MRKRKLILLAAAAVLIGAIWAKASAPEPELVTYHYTVEAGDTLWSVAAKYTSDEEDVREVIWRIRTDSGIGRSEYIQPGQKLVIRVRPAA